MIHNSIVIVVTLTLTMFLTILVILLPAMCRFRLAVRSREPPVDPKSFPKLGVPSILGGVPIIRIIVFWSPYWVTLLGVATTRRSGLTSEMRCALAASMPRE